MRELSKVPKIQVHFTRPSLVEMPLVKTSKQANKVFRECFAPGQMDVKEFFYAMFLTNSNHVIGISLLGVGGC